MEIVFVYVVVVTSVLVAEWLFLSNKGLKSELEYFKKVYKEALNRNYNLSQNIETYSKHLGTTQEEVISLQHQQDELVQLTNELDTIKRQAITYLKLLCSLEEELTLVKIKNVLLEVNTDKPLLIKLIGDLNQIYKDPIKTLDKLNECGGMNCEYSYDDLLRTIIPTGTLFSENEWDVLNSTYNMVTIARPCNSDIAHTLYLKCKNENLTVKELKKYIKTLRATKE